jgi:tetratricopeptide (TPR) repeat protein
LGRAKIDSQRHDYKDAQAKLRRAVEILESLPQSETQIRTALADSYADLGAMLCASGDDAKAIDYLQKAIRIQEELSQQSGTSQLNSALKINHE